MGISMFAVSPLYFQRGQGGAKVCAPTRMAVEGGATEGELAVEVLQPNSPSPSLNKRGENDAVR
jgi:hypothetical protein